MSCYILSLFASVNIGVYHLLLFICYDYSADLQNAIDGEDYGLAAKLRDEISKLEAESLAVSAKALAFENAEYAFRLGQKLKHKAFGNIVICISASFALVLHSSWRTYMIFFICCRLQGCSLRDGSSLL